MAPSRVYYYQHCICIHEDSEGRHNQVSRMCACYNALSNGELDQKNFHPEGNRMLANGHWRYATMKPSFRRLGMPHKDSFLYGTHKHIIFATFLLLRACPTAIGNGRSHQPVSLCQCCHDACWGLQYTRSAGLAGLRLPRLESLPRRCSHDV